MHRISTLDDAFNPELSDLYNAEKQLTRALPKMVRATTDIRLIDERAADEALSQMACGGLNIRAFQSSGPLPAL